jgi:copper chaperone CopZ
MKNILSALLLSVFIVAPAMAANDASCKQPQSVATVDGMVCDFCTQSITKVLKKDAAVKDVAVDLNTKKVTVDIASGKEFTDETLAKAIDYAGYKLVKIDHACKG